MSDYLDLGPLFATHSLFAPPPPQLKKDSMSWEGRGIIGEVRKKDGSPS